MNGKWQVTLNLIEKLIKLKNSYREQGGREKGKGVRQVKGRYQRLGLDPHMKVLYVK